MKDVSAMFDNMTLLGRTGLMVSEIGLGCEGFKEKDEDFTHKWKKRTIYHAGSSMLSL